MHILTAHFANAALSVLPGAQILQDQEAAMFGAMVNRGSSIRLDKHGTCRVITNKGGAPIMVPASTPEEWSVGQTAFLNNISSMLYVSVAPCAAPAPASPLVVTVWDVDDLHSGHYFVDFVTKKNASGKPDSYFETPAFSGGDYGATLPFPTVLCKRADGSPAIIRKPAGTYDYNAVAATVWDGGDYTKFYAEASQGVLMPESGYCTMAVRFEDDPNVAGNKLISYNYIIGN
jgi:hypothetical protein